MQHIFQENKPILINNSLFRSIPESDIPILLKHLEAYTGQYKKDTFIKMTGDPADFIGIVLSGEIYICQTDFYGNRSIVASFTAGNLFAEAFACAGIAQLPADILAAADCRILFLSSRILFQSCDRCSSFHHQLIANLLGIVSKRNLYLNQKLSYTSRGTTKEKLLAYLSDQAKQNHSNEFTIPFNRQELADYLCVDRSAMSQELSKMKRDGLIDFERNSFTLLKEFQ